MGLKEKIIQFGGGDSPYMNKNKRTYPVIKALEGSFTVQPPEINPSSATFFVQIIPLHASLMDIYRNAMLDITTSFSDSSMFDLAIKTYLATHRFKKGMSFIKYLKEFSFSPAVMATILNVAPAIVQVFESFSKESVFQISANPKHILRMCISRHYHSCLGYAYTRRALAYAFSPGSFIAFQRDKSGHYMNRIAFRYRPHLHKLECSQVYGQKLHSSITDQLIQGITNQLIHHEGANIWHSSFDVAQAYSEYS